MNERLATKTDFPRGRIDGPWRMVSAELYASRQILAHERRRLAFAERRTEAMEMYTFGAEELLKSIRSRDSSEPMAWRTDEAHVIRCFEKGAARLAEMRAEEDIRDVAAGIALEAIDDNFQRVEFAIVALRYENDLWPTGADVRALLTDRLGMTDEEACQAMTAAVNEPSQISSGTWLVWNGTDLAKGMGFAHPVDGADRLYVTAEAQHYHQLHPAYQAWSFERTVSKEDDQ